MDTGRLEILKADINKQIEVIDIIYGKILKRCQNYKNNEERMESLAYHLHNLYCAFEDLMILVANSFENQIYESPKWYTLLLRRMTQNIPNIRPSLFSDVCYSLLDELRAFRHLFRHAYSYQIDQDKLDIVIKKAFELEKLYKSNIQRFLDLLNQG